MNGDGGGGVTLGGGRGADGWLFTHNLSGTTKINEYVLVLLLSHAHKHH